MMTTLIRVVRHQALGELCALSQASRHASKVFRTQALDIAHQSFNQHGAEQQRWQALVECNAMLCLVQHARGDLDAASTSADVAQALADHTDPRRASSGAHRDAAIPAALQRIGALRLAMVSFCMGDLTSSGRKVEGTLQG